MICMAKLSTSQGFTKGGKCGCFILINKLHSWVQSALHAIWVQLLMLSMLFCQGQTQKPRNV